MTVIPGRSDALKAFGALMLHTSIPDAPGCLLDAKAEYTRAWQEAWWDRRPHTQLGPQGDRRGALHWYWGTTGEIAQASPRDSARMGPLRPSGYDPGTDDPWINYRG